MVLTGEEQERADALGEPWKEERQYCNGSTLTVQCVWKCLPLRMDFRQIQISTLESVCWVETDMCQ